MGDSDKVAGLKKNVSSTNDSIGRECRVMLMGMMNELANTHKPHRNNVPKL